MGIRLRWLAIGIFVLSSTLNYLDRQLLAALAPSIMGEFHLSNLQYGEIFSAFSFVYALMAPVSGLLLDRAGLNLGMSISVVLWSCASAATGLTHSFAALLGCRLGLGIAESAGIPGTGKANGMYLESRELAFGTAINQVGISVGMFFAPLLVAAVAPRYGWRFVFVVCGAMSVLWVPLWLFTSRRIPARNAPVSKGSAGAGGLIRDSRFWGLMFATVFLMALYTLWSNWTTVYFVHEWHLTQEEANRRFAWIPPIFATLGGFFGAIMSFYWIRRGVPVLTARMRVFWISGVVLLTTALIPVMPSPAFANVVICLSFFLCLASSTNLYALPIDLFGPSRAAFGVSGLTCAYGLMTALFSPAIGAIVDHVGFPSVCIAAALLPLVGAWIIRAALHRNSEGRDRAGTNRDLLHVEG